MSRPTCATCPWWAVTFPTTRECRRMPPMEMGRTLLGVDAPIWPRTGGTDWCGEHPGMAAWMRETADV